MIKVHDDHSNNSNSQLCMPIIIILTLLAIGNSCRPCLGDGFRRSHAFPAAEIEVFGLSISGRVCDAGPGLWRWRLGVFRIEGPSTWTNFWLKSKSFPHVQQGFSWVPNPWSPPGKQLASACWDGVARIYDLENEVEPMELRGHTGGGVVILFPTRQSPWCFSLRGFFNSKSKVVICCYFPGGFCTKSTMVRTMSAPPRRPLWGTLAAQDLCEAIIKGYSSGVNYIIIIS